MTKIWCCRRPRRPARAGGCAARAVALAALLLAPQGAPAQEPGADTPLPPPASAPASRLTITPSEFERWRAGTAGRPDIAAVPQEASPGLVAAPPPPLLVAPPPPPSLVVPPPPLRLAPPPAPTVPEAPVVQPSRPRSGAPAAGPEPGLVSPPPAPVLTPPADPQVATLPPDSRDTTPPPTPPTTLPRPAEIRILYAADATDLPEAAHADLDGLAAWLKANPEVRVQIVGYASETAPSGSEARRRSLFRTLAVRTYLIENGVLSTRMDVRALGPRTEEEPKDRVEVRVPPS